MATFLVGIFFLARPIMFIHAPFQLWGLNLFELLTILFTAVLAVVALVSFVTSNNRGVSGVEWSILVFVTWVTLITLFYSETSIFKHYVRFVLPPLTYLIIKRAIGNRDQFMKVLMWLIVGFTVPVFYSAILILQGKGITMDRYLTGLRRFAGAYSDLHPMGHSMALVIVVLVMYWTMVKSFGGAIAARMNWWKYPLFAAIVLAALFCLYKSSVRTAFVGLLVFFFVWLFYANKKYLVLFVAALSVGGLLATPYLVTHFDDLTLVATGDLEVDKAGSGRLYIWRLKLDYFSSLSIDRKLSGTGVNNEWSPVAMAGKADRGVRAWNSHNDFLEVMMQTGVIGLILYLAIYVAMFRRVVRLDGGARPLYLALFAAIMLMNLLSNSYISRFGLSQLFFMLMIYTEIPGVQKPARTPVQRPSIAPLIVR